MFTGIIRHLGKMISCTSQGNEATLQLSMPEELLDQAAIGDSIAVNGCCLTLAHITKDGFAEFSLGKETLARTAPLLIRDKVHLEPSLRVGDQFGGHFVTGHIDGCVKLADFAGNDSGAMVTFTLPPEIDPRFVVLKGSVAVGGISLTVAAVTDTTFTVQLIEHTMAVTLLHPQSMLVAGTDINFEVDCLARYAVSGDSAVLESFAHMVNHNNV